MKAKDGCGENFWLEIKPADQGFIVMPEFIFGALSAKVVLHKLSNALGFIGQADSKQFCI